MLSLQSHDGPYRHFEPIFKVVLVTKPMHSNAYYIKLKDLKWKQIGKQFFALFRSRKKMRDRIIYIKTETVYKILFRKKTSSYK